MKNLDRVWKLPRLQLRTKMRLYTTLVIPVLLYASETWTLTKADMTHMQAFHMRCQRQILGIRWQDKVKNTEIQRRTGLSHIGTLIQARRHSFFGHIVRMNQKAPAHIIAKLCHDISMRRRIPEGWKRPRGRPRTTWLSQIKQDNGLPLSTSWRKACDRMAWSVDAKALHGYAVQ